MFRGEFLSFPDKDELRKDAARCEAFTKALFTLSKLFSESELPPVTDVFDIFGKVVNYLYCVVFLWMYNFDLDMCETYTNKGMQ